MQLKMKGNTDQLVKLEEEASLLQKNFEIMGPTTQSLRNLQEDVLAAKIKYKSPPLLPMNKTLF